jgi:hypothetical protein
MTNTENASFVNPEQALWEELLPKYLIELKTKTGLSFEAIAAKSNVVESTVKSLFSTKTGNPRLLTVAPVVYSLGGSMDGIFFPQRTKDAMLESTILALKDGYNHDVSIIKNTYDAQTNDIRVHYEQHCQDLKDTYKKIEIEKERIIELYERFVAQQLKDKDDLIAHLKEQLRTQKEYYEKLIRDKSKHKEAN